MLHQPKPNNVLKGKVFMVEQINNFCNSESRRRQILNSTYKRNQENSNMHTGSTTKVSIDMTDRLQRAASKSNEVNHPMKSILQNFEMKNLLRIKFLDCMLREVEGSVLGVTKDRKSEVSNDSNSLKRPRRSTLSIPNKYKNSFPSSMLNRMRHQKQKHTTLHPVFHHKRFARESKPISSSSRKESRPMYNVHNILVQYYHIYKEDITASKEKIQKVFCVDSFDATSSNTNQINQTWSNIVASLEKYLEEVKFGL